jgi:hypothetical protein
VAFTASGEEAAAELVDFDGLVVKPFNLYSLAQGVLSGLSLAPQSNESPHAAE